MVKHGVFPSEGGKFFYNHLFVLLRINTYSPRQIWQVLARAPLRVAVGRLRTTPLLHICASPAAAGHELEPGPVEDAFTSAAFKFRGGGGKAGGPVGRTRSGLGGGCS